MLFKKPTLEMMMKGYLDLWANGGELFVLAKDADEIKKYDPNGITFEKCDCNADAINSADISITEKYLKDELKEKFGFEIGDSGWYSDFVARNFIESNSIGAIESAGANAICKMKGGGFPFDGANDVWPKLRFPGNGLTEEEVKAMKAGNMKEGSPQREDSSGKRHSFFMFLMSQRFRSVGFKKKVDDYVKNHELVKLYGKPSECLFPMVMWNMTNWFAYLMCRDTYCIELISNDTGVGFVTSDCPVVLLNPNRPPKYYYSLCSTQAIICHPAQNNSSRKANTSEVEKWNTMVYEARQRYVFASSEDELKKCRR